MQNKKSPQEGSCKCARTPPRHVTLPSADDENVRSDTKTTQPGDDAVVQAKEWVERGSKL